MNSWDFKRPSCCSAGYSTSGLGWVWAVEGFIGYATVAGTGGPSVLFYYWVSLILYGSSLSLSNSCDIGLFSPSGIDGVLRAGLLPIERFLSALLSIERLVDFLDALAILGFLPSKALERLVGSFLFSAFATFFFALSSSILWRSISLYSPGLTKSSSTINFLPSFLFCFRRSLSSTWS